MFLVKSLTYSCVKYTPRVPLTLLKVKKIEHKSWFCYCFSFFLSLIRLKNYRPYNKHLTHQKTTLLSEMFLFWVKAKCKLWLVGYGFKHAWQSLSNVPFCMYLQEYRLSLDNVHIQQLLYYWRQVFCGLEFREWSKAEFTLGPPSAQVPWQVLSWLRINRAEHELCIYTRIVSNN